MPETPQTMTAYRLLEWGKGGYDEVPVPKPGALEVLLKVGGVGICGSDLSFLRMSSGGWPASPPWTLGHEIGGWVAERGSGVTSVNVGDAVLATGADSCGRCEFCLRGRDNLCPTTVTGRGCGTDGGLASYVVVPERQLVPLIGLDPRSAAPLTDAGHTSYGAVKAQVPRLAPGTTAMVVGCGGLGSFAVQYLALLTRATIIVVDVSEQRLAYARELGAHHSVRAGENAADDVRRLTAGRGVDAVFDFVGHQDSIDLAVSATRIAGSISIAGLGQGSIPFEWGRTPALASEIIIRVGGSLPELHEVVTAAESGKLTIDVEHFAFDQIDDALGRLARGELRGRAVITPNG